MDEYTNKSVREHLSSLESPKTKLRECVEITKSYAGTESADPDSILRLLDGLVTFFDTGKVNLAKKQ